MSSFNQQDPRETAPDFGRSAPEAGRDTSSDVTAPPASHPAPPEPAPASHDAPPPSSSGLSPQTFAERALSELTAAYPNEIAKRTRREMLALIERGCERAGTYGLEQEEHVLKFLHCIVLLDNELSKSSSNTDAESVILTLTVPNRSAEDRIKRALNISKKAYAARMERKSRSDAAGSGSAGGGSSHRSPQPQSNPSPQPSPRSSPRLSPRPSPTPAAEPLIPTPARPVHQTPRRMPVAAEHSVPATVDDNVHATRSEPPPAIENFKSDDAERFPDIEGFRILEKIASGGMGTVYRAHDLQLDIEVAIKVVRSMHPSAQQQFLLEARAAAKLQHPYVIPVLRYEQYGQGGYCVMQLVKGYDAHRLVKVFGQNTANSLKAERILDLAGVDRQMMNPELRSVIKGDKPYYRIVAYWLAGVAEGLERAHAEGIIHYDVKPSNMILSQDGRLLLGDFGLATLAGQNPSQNSACVGTPAYLSPEMLAAWACRSGPADTDGRVDIWGLGCALYELLTFKPTFDGTMGQVLRAIATADPTPPRSIIWDVPEPLEQICLKALARNPENRYNRALEMADALRDFLAGKFTDAPANDSKGFFGWRKGK